jgi:hypothetical protein
MPRSLRGSEVITAWWGQHCRHILLQARSPSWCDGLCAFTDHLLTNRTTASMIEITSISDLPSIPAVYAMYGSRGRIMYVAYVGVAGKLKARIVQRLVRRDSSVTKGKSAVALNPDYVTELRRWKHPGFSEWSILEAPATNRVPTTCCRIFRLAITVLKLSYWELC